MSETKVLDVLLAGNDDADQPCATCGEDLYVGDQVCWEPLGLGPPYERVIVLSHAACSVKNGYRLDYSDIERGEQDNG